MASKGRAVKNFSPGLLIFAVILLSNPTVNVFDYFPDFIGCFIICAALGFFAERVPYFDEAKADFLRLGYISLLRIPSFIIMIRITAQNMHEGDLKILLTFVFAVIEAYFAIKAISSLFLAVSYLGQRSDAASLITCFKISGKRELAPEKLQIMCYVFVICKGVLNVIPEFLLLSNSESELNPTYFSPALLYPYAILLSFLLIFIFGIVVSFISSKFIKAIHKEGLLYSAAESLIDDLRREEMKKTKKIAKMHRFLTMVTLSSVFLLDFCSKKLGGVNIIPDFMFGVMIIFTFVGAAQFIKGYVKIVVSSIIFSVISLVKYIFEILFLNKFTYEQLPISSSATAEFLPVILISVVEFLSFALLLVLIGFELIIFTKQRTGISPKKAEYSSLDKEYHSIMAKKCIGWVIIGISLGAVKLIGTLTRGVIIGFTPISFAFLLLFVMYGYYLFGSIKEEIYNKYF